MRGRRRKFSPKRRKAARPCDRGCWHALATPIMFGIVHRDLASRGDTRPRRGHREDTRGAGSAGRQISSEW